MRWDTSGSSRPGGSNSQASAFHKFTAPRSDLHRSALDHYNHNDSRGPYHNDSRGPYHDDSRGLYRNAAHSRGFRQL